MENQDELARISEMSRLSKKYQEEVAKKLEQILSEQKYYTVGQNPLPQEPKKVEESIKQEQANRKKLENKAFEQDIALKKNTLIILFLFLGLETVAVFAYAFFQATGMFNFELEEWSFKLLLTATITQITLMVHVAVRHLYPKK